MRAAILRGSRTMTSPLTTLRKAGGTRVVFPAPGGASRTRLCVCCREARISGRIASTGSAGLRLTSLIGTRCFLWSQRHTAGTVLEGMIRRELHGWKRVCRRADVARLQASLEDYLDCKLNAAVVTRGRGDLTHC